MGVPDADITEVIGPAFGTDGMAAVHARDDQGRLWVVWAPLTDEAALGIESQRDVLAALASEVRAGHLLFDVPRPSALVQIGKNEGFAMVAPALPGGLYADDDIARTVSLAKPLAEALASLHSLRPSVRQRTGVPDYSVDECRQHIHAEIDEAAESGVIPPSLYNRWEGILDDVNLWRFTPRVVHGALSAECLWLKPGKVCAISDFSRAHVGDPAEDLAWVVSIATDEFLDAFIDAYAKARRLDDTSALIERSAFMGEIALVRWLLHGMHAHDQEIIEDARGLLRELADALDETAAEASDQAPKPGPDDADPDQANQPTERVDMNQLTERVDMNEVFGR